MNRSKKKSFDWYGMRQRFSIRKYHIGAASVLLGMTLVLGTGTIVSAETGVNGDGDSNGQIVPGNNDGISDGTQPQGDNQGDNSSGVQTGNTTNSTANVQPAGDTGSASSLPVGTLRSADTGTQGDGSTNPTVAEPVVNPRTMALTPVGDGLTNPPVADPIMIIPSSATATAPQGYVTVTFEGNQFTQGFTLGNQTGSLVKVFVKNDVTWGTLLDDPAWQWPTVKTAPGDTVVGWAVNITYNGTYNPNNAFARDKYKDTVVTNTKLYPNVVYEVEDVNYATKEQYLALYGSDDRDKWIFIKFDAGQGRLSGSKQSKMVAVSNNLYPIDFSNNKFREKVESPTLQGHTFVRWQTDAGEVLPKSGTITTETTYKALYLAHPQNKVAVFDSANLTTSEKEQVKKNILDANPDLSTGVAPAIKAIDISDTGEATVTFDDDTVVTVSSATLTNEDQNTARSNAKAEIERDATEKSDAINASNLTEEEKREKLDEVNNAKAAADRAIDQASTSDEL
ncbi:TPA: YSIRK-type signal peptide-containing protein, partial [Streptococcus suis]